jgi:hypothetical protein
LKQALHGRYLPWALLALALAIRILVAWPIRQPGYTDAYYYAVGARQLYAGQGFDLPFIWNYLHPPQSLPQPGYLYWMPLTALLAWLGTLGLGDTFRAMQVPFVLLSALLPLVTYGLARDLVGGSFRSALDWRKHALLAALLAILPGFYSHVLVVTDNFTPFALAGSICLWAAGRGLARRQPLWFGLAGLAAGFGHLARADGLLLAGVAALAALGQGFFPSPEPAGDRARQAPPLSEALVGALLVLAGYLAVMAPWFIRNWLVLGTPLAPAGTRTIFLTSYDDMFAYGRPPTLQGYLAWGWPAILRSKLQALLLNLQRLWVENLLIVLLPLSGLGLWHLRRERVLWPFFLYLPSLFVAMTLVFTFPGTRGGLYHSGGALMPFFFAAAGPGLEVVLRWAARRLRGWHVRRAWPVFGSGLILLAALLMILALGRAGALDGSWNDRDEGYARIGEWLAEQKASRATVMVGDAPGFAWHTGHPAIAVPNEPLDTILDVAARYEAEYLVLDAKRPRTTDALYDGETSHPRLHLVFEKEEWQVYEIDPLPQLCLLY